jgi:hypothetical protein
MALRRFNGVLRPSGSVYINASNQNWKSPPLHLKRRNMVSDIASSLRVRSSGGDWVCTPAWKHRDGASPKHKGFGRELIECAAVFAWRRDSI